MSSVLSVKNLKKWFPVSVGWISSLRGKEEYLRAVDGVSFNIDKGEIFGLVGESGCGKTTTARCIMKLVDPTEGEVIFQGEDISSFNKKRMTSLRNKMQIIFQNPYESLDPLMSIQDILLEPLLAQKVPLEERKSRVNNAIESVGLPLTNLSEHFPHELSGGERQRVAIARAVILNPNLIIADEPLSMLDVSIRTSILNLMTELRDKLGVSYLYITHDLAIAYNICDKIGIMYLGKIVEQGDARSLIENPAHPYTKALISAVAIPDPEARKSRVTIKGEVPNPLNIPPGCRFYPRCKEAADICKQNEPEKRDLEQNHEVSCHLAF